MQRDITLRNLIIKLTTYTYFIKLCRSNVSYTDPVPLQPNSSTHPHKCLAALLIQLLFRTGIGWAHKSYTTQHMENTALQVRSSISFIVLRVVWPSQPWNYSYRAVPAFSILLIFLLSPFIIVRVCPPVRSRPTWNNQLIQWQQRTGIRHY